MKERTKPFENTLDGCSKSCAEPLDDTQMFRYSQEQIIASDKAFQAALDRAVTMKLERCSTSVNTAPCTKNPIFIPHDIY